MFKTLTQFLAGVATIPMVIFPQFAWSAGPSKTQPRPVAKLMQTIEQSKTMGQFYDALEKGLHPRQREHFLEQMEVHRKQTKTDWRSQRMPLKLEKVDGRKLYFLDTDSNRKFTFEIVNEKDVFVRLNGQALSRAELENPKLFWDRIAVNSTGNRSFSLLNLLIPQAHAFWMGLLGLGAIFLGANWLFNDSDWFGGYGGHRGHGCISCHHHGRGRRHSRY